MTAAEVRDTRELEVVEAWRLEELERAGYPRAAAERLAPRHDIDLHVAVDLLRRGCPVEVALDILI
jgi:hypothetical protein